MQLLFSFERMSFVVQSVDTISIKGINLVCIDVDLRLFLEVGHFIETSNNPCSMVLDFASTTGLVFFDLFFLELQGITVMLTNKSTIKYPYFIERILLSILDSNVIPIFKTIINNEKINT